MGGVGDDDGAFVVTDGPTSGLIISMVPEPTAFTLIALAGFSTPAIRCKRRINEPIVVPTPRNL